MPATITAEGLLGGKLPNRVSIEERPEVVEQRERLGDWEVDTLVGKGQRGALVSLVERKSRFTLMRPVDQRLADLVSQAMISLLRPFADLVHTITGDYGSLLATIMAKSSQIMPRSLKH